MKKTFILLTVLLICATTLFAQTTREQADAIIKEHLQNEMVQYNLLYVHANVPSIDGITITTSNEEIFSAKYACWAYYLDESEYSQRRYLFVKEDNGNLLEVIASNDNGSADTNQWLLVETVNLSERQENNIKLLYPNPTSGQLTIDNGEFRVENVEIFDVLGKKQETRGRGQKAESGRYELDISHLSAGIYLLKIRTETGITTRKIIKN